MKGRAQQLLVLAGASRKILLAHLRRPCAAGTVHSRPVLTSLPLQVFLYFGGWWDVLFWISNIAVFIYKGGGPPPG